MPSSDGTESTPNGAVDIHQRHINGLQNKDISNELRTSLPADFYTSPEIYELERRAIFSQRWFLVSHEARYRQIGDYVQYEMAGFDFVLVRGKDERLIGFHNLCRHRGFPVVQKTTGNAKLFSCKYHGWTYDLHGKLTKAPRFVSNSVPAFDSSNIHLFPVHVHVDRNGFVYVNLSAAEVPEVSWKAQYGQMDQQAVLANSGIDWGKVEYVLGWTKDGQFNWKVMQENFNECYHCQTAHPDVAKTTALDTYYVVQDETKGYISHFSEPKESMYRSSEFDMTRINGRSATHVFPVGHFSPNPGTGFMHMMRSVPLSATTTRQEYDVYKLNTSTASDGAHQRMLKFYQKVIDEDFALCEGLQRSIERGVWESGPLHPFYEEGVHLFQATVVELLKAHVAKEKANGREIRPASRKATGMDGEDRGPICEILESCKGISACVEEGTGGLKW